MASSLNSTYTPLLIGATWTGSLESCKNQSTISCSLLADTGCTLTILHLDKNGNTQYADELHSVSNTCFYKQVVSKSTHFKVTLYNESPATDQTTCRLITKLSNSAPDNMNVNLSHTEDSVVAHVVTSEGAVSSEAGKLLVKQNALVATGDSVMAHGYTSMLGSSVALSCDESGRLNVNTNEVASAPTWNIVLHTGSLQTTPVLLSSGTGKLLRLNAFNDSVQVRYIRFYDSVGEPVYSNTAKCVVVVPSNTNVSIEMGWNIYNALYIVGASAWGATTAYGIVDADELLATVVLEVAV